MGQLNSVTDYLGSLLKRGIGEEMLRVEQSVLNLSVYYKDVLISTLAFLYGQEVHRQEFHWFIQGARNVAAECMYSA